MYTLDIETMKQIMLAHKKTGHLHADLPLGVPSLRESCHVEIVLEAGNIVSCSIASSRGLLLTGDDAYQEITRLGRIRWTFVPQSPPVTLPETTTRALVKKIVYRPRRMAVVMQWQMGSWPRIYKLTYGLADGTRSIAEIAALLSTTPEAIEEALHGLQSIHVIAME